MARWFAVSLVCLFCVWASPLVGKAMTFETGVLEPSVSVVAGAAAKAIRTGWDTNGLDGSRAWSCDGQLTGTVESTLGISLRADSPKDADTLEFDAKARGNTLFLAIHARDRAHREYRAVIPIASTWRHFTVPFYRIEPFGDKSSTAPVRLRDVHSVTFAVNGAIPGENGFSVDNIRFSSRVGEAELHADSVSTLSVQRDSVLVLQLKSGLPQFEAKDLAVWCEPSDRNELLVPERVSFTKDGKAFVPVFLRNVGPYVLRFFEPYSGAETSTTIYGRVEGLRARGFIEEFEKQQSILAPSEVRPRVQLEGDATTLPLSAQVLVLDHRHRPILSQILSVAELSAGSRPLLIPMPGLFEVRMRFYAEPLATNRKRIEGLPRHIGFQHEIAETSVPLSLPEGVTTQVVGGYLLALEESPTTATLLAEDRFALWAFAKAPTEVRLPLTLFGVTIPGLFELPLVELDRELPKLLGWYARIGAVWVSFPVSGARASRDINVDCWPCVETIARMAKSKGLRPVISVGAPPSAVEWADVSTTAPGEKWLQWLTRCAWATRDRVRIFEIRDTVESSTSGPQRITSDAYNALLRHAWRALFVRETTPTLLGGSSGELDLEHLSQVLGRGVRDWTDATCVALPPPAPWLSPAENHFERLLALVRNVARSHGLLKRPLFATRVGWPTGIDGVTEKEQANYLVRAYTMLAAEKWIRLFWADLRDWSLTPWVGGPEHHLGLLSADLRPKPAAVAYNLTLYMLTQTVPRGVTRQGKAHVYSFDIQVHSAKWPGVLHVAWTERLGEEAEVEVPATAGLGIYAFDYLGAEVLPAAVTPERSVTHGEELRLSSDEKATTQVYRFRVTHEPVFIWDVGGPPSQSGDHQHKHDHVHSEH